MLEAIKTELIWSPYDNTVYDRVCELIKEMEGVVEEGEKKV
jgi:hypothetical protein